MGISYEMNWYLVTTENKFNNINEKIGTIIKEDKRIYPIGAEIPFIIKNVGCMGMVEILSFKVSENSTEVTFKKSDKYKNNKEILNHYYDFYLSRK
ncbi:hypothetical protein [Fusobacterium sp. MFO224]|uniref:hypothetical protein n=1 Tax=Fusobacterium sp. MFO224 TaxID=3378070 RepID=UPI0038542B73